MRAVIVRQKKTRS